MHLRKKIIQQFQVETYTVKGNKNPVVSVPPCDLKESLD